MDGLDAIGVVYEVVNIHASGHYPKVEKREEFNRLLNQTINKIKAGCSTK